MIESQNWKFYPSVKTMTFFQQKIHFDYCVQPRKHQAERKERIFTEHLQVPSA